MSVLDPRIGVVIPTHERAELLERSLESLATQTLPSTAYEVVVVDDGSADGTADVCRRAAGSLPLRYLRIESSGISAAKNLGLFACKAPLVLFFDDDDRADPRLLEAHVEAHRAHPQDNVAVLGYTTWAPELEVTPLMEYVTEIGQLLFAYRNIEHGQALDHTYFWGGRSSCKRSFLVQHGSFDQELPAMEDMELGYRLARHGLVVLHDRSAQSYMLRAVTFDEFARRCVKRGRALWMFHARHPDPAVERYGRISEALQKWPSLAPSLPAKIERIRELEERHADDGGLDDSALAELRQLYGWAFEALEVRGIAEAQAEAFRRTARDTPPISSTQAQAAAICPDPVFIIGSPRSGTSVLAHSLAQHSEFWVSGESYFLFHLFSNGLAERAFDRAMEVAGSGWLRIEGVSREEFLAHVGMGLNALITSHSRGRRWIDHTPHYTLIVETLGRLFPGARFLHILRDGREVVHSMLNFADSHPDQEVREFLRSRVPWATEIRSACEFWRDHVEAAMAFCDLYPDRAMVVRYDDLVATPEATFRAIHDFLGAADEHGPADFLRSTRINSSFKGRSRLSGAAIWELWGEDERRLFTEVAERTMDRCGFSIPDELGSLRNGGRLRVEPPSSELETSRASVEQNPPAL